MIARNPDGTFHVACQLFRDDGIKPREFYWDGISVDDYLMNLCDAARCVFECIKLKVNALPEQVRRAEDHFA